MTEPLLAQPSCVVENPDHPLAPRTPTRVMSMYSYDSWVTFGPTAVPEWLAVRAIVTTRSVQPVRCYAVEEWFAIARSRIAVRAPWKSVPVTIAGLVALCESGKIDPHAMRELLVLGGRPRIRDVVDCVYVGDAGNP